MRVLYGYTLKIITIGWVAMQFNEKIIRFPSLDDVIERFPLTINPDSYVIEAIVLMSQCGNKNKLNSSGGNYNWVTSCVLVIRERQLLGIFTQSDLVKLIAGGKDLSKVKMWEGMSSPVVTLQEADCQDIFTALSLLHQNRFRHLPIINKKEELVGLVTEMSLLQAFESVKISGLIEDFHQHLQINQQLETTLVELQAAEDELRQQNEELVMAREIAELERQRYQDLFEFAPDAYLVTDPTGKILEANRAATTLLSLKLNYLIGKPLLVFIAQSDRQKFLTQLRDLEHIQEWEINLQPRKNKSFCASMKVVAMYDLVGQLNGWRWLISDITERKALQAKLFYDAFHDPLTGLSNRALFIDHLKQAVEQKKRRENYLFAVLFLDLDGFKLINDSLGHDAGDQLLIAFGMRLKACLRTIDTLARLGGDEFAILLTEPIDIGNAIKIAERIQKQLTSPFSLNGQQIFIGTSIGIVLSTVEHLLPDEILRDADTAMYHAKSQGKRRYEIFEPAMRTHALSRLQLINDLHRAVENNDFQVYYQPIIKLKTGKIIGFEALARWEHPSDGFISPNVFIPVAEETGLIVDLGYQILHSACHQLYLWQKDMAENSSLRISVNISSQQFLQRNFPMQIQKILQETNIAACNLILEIPEKSLDPKNDNSITEKLVQLTTLGVKLSIDNFGTGYSSLICLEHLLINKLKIDRIFITGIGIDKKNLEITTEMITLCHLHNMDVTAEGIETKEQLVFLRQLNCDYGQGYFFSHPLDSAAATAFLSHPTWSGVGSWELEATTN